MIKKERGEGDEPVGGVADLAQEGQGCKEMQASGRVDLWTPGLSGHWFTPQPNRSGGGGGGGQWG